MTSELARLRKLSEKATQGEWRSNASSISDYKHPFAIIIYSASEAGTHRLFVGGGQSDVGRVDDIANSELAAACVNYVRAALSPAPGDAEAVAWRFEAAEYINKDTGEITGWRECITKTKPHAGEFMRNLTPLYASPPSPAPEAEKMREALRPFAEFCEALNFEEPDYEKFIYRRGFVLTFGHFRAARAALKEEKAS